LGNSGWQRKTMRAWNSHRLLRLTVDGADAGNLAGFGIEDDLVHHAEGEHSELVRRLRWEKAGVDAA
jgi:hypothetical protein